MNPEKLRKVRVGQAIGAYRKSDKSRWVSALWCAQVVGNYDAGATKAMAQDMGVSTDTVEDLARAYGMFVDLCSYNNGMYRSYVFWARRCPYIYLSHFRALADARTKYNLKPEEVMSYLVDVVQHEGTTSSRDVTDQINKAHGDPDWDYVGKQVQKKIEKLLEYPDLPAQGRREMNSALKWLKGELNDR